MEREKETGPSGMDVGESAMYNDDNYYATDFPGLISPLVAHVV